jgi:hypothetical protein
LKQPATFLCLRCHPGHYSASHPAKNSGFLAVGAPGATTSTSLRRPLYTDCTLCHQQIHGTNQYSEQGANGRFTR